MAAIWFTSVPLKRLKRQRKPSWEVLRVLEILPGGVGLGLDNGKGGAPRSIGEYPLGNAYCQMEDLGGGP